MKVWIVGRSASGDGRTKLEMGSQRECCNQIQQNYRGVGSKLVGGEISSGLSSALKTVTLHISARLQISARHLPKQSKVGWQ